MTIHSDVSSRWPRWLRDLDQSLPVRSQFVLTGNIRDIHLMPDAVGTADVRPVPLLDCLWTVFSRSGYEFLAVYDPVDGINIHPREPDALTAGSDVLGMPLDQGPRAVSLDGLRSALAAVVNAEGRRAAFVIDYASRLVSDAQNLSEAEHDYFVSCEKLARTAGQIAVGQQRPVPLYNPVLWLVHSERDLPDWFVVDNERIRIVPISRPDFGDRYQAASTLSSLFEDAESKDDTHEELLKIFAGLSDGMTLSGMVEVTRLALDQGLTFADIEDAVRSYKVGILEQPWRRDYLMKRIKDAEQEIPQRVLGQPQATTKALDILKRSVMGLSGAQASATSARPRGVLFFAGPTGVGKTELAKTITEHLFGDQQAYVRFDMSEFSEEHAAARLIGAPPGYVGYEAGGELTDAVRERPFCLVLFDEIEKAHHRILDKFLQILDDGRLTDGRGQTVHFSETILVFTSNLGILVEDHDGRRTHNITSDMPYEEVDRRLTEAIEDHFNLVLNRPELLNRLGDNIVVFDFIRPQAARAIFDVLVSNIERRVEREHHAQLVIPAEVREQLLDWCIEERHLAHGGRGIGTALEEVLVNPLARALFSQDGDIGEALTVSAVTRQDDTYSVLLE